MRSFLQIFFFLFSFTAFSQNFFQFGADIDGEAAEDYSGRSVSLSSDGTILAIGAQYNDGNGNTSGHVRVYKYANNSWTQLGADIDGEADGDGSGRSVSLSSDGTKLAIGAMNNGGNGSGSGHVRVYKYANNSWTQIGNDIDGEAAGDRNGGSVSLSSDGTILAMGADYNDGNGSNSGHVRVYEFKSEPFSYTNWKNSEPNDAGVGSGTENYAMIVDGLWNDISNNDGGISKHYLLETNQLINSLGGYTYLGQYLGHSYFKSNSPIGSWTAARDQAYKDGGYLVTMTSEAERNKVNSWFSSTAFIGLYQDANDPNYSEPSGGWKWVEHWDQIGSDIDGEAAEDRNGNSVSLSSDGTILAMGAYYNDGNGSNSGHVRVYSYANNSWTQLGNDIDGEADGDWSGISISLSSDGKKLAIGAQYNDGNGSNSGHVRVYSYANNSWTQLGNDIDGEAASDKSGSSVSLSSDGTILAIGAYGNDGNGSNSGHVRVYKYANNSWTQLGADIDGEAANDVSGWSAVSLSSDGTKLAIGAMSNDGNGNGSGHVRAFEFTPSVTLSVSSSSIAEAAGASTVTATLSAVYVQTVTVTLAASGTATGGGTDYTLASSTITIPAGQTTGTTTVTAVHDVLDEANETVILDITGVTNANENGTQQQTITISDDDNPPTVNLSINPSSIAEAAGASTVTASTVTATLSAVSGQTVTVTLAASGTATGGGTDYTLASSTITIPAGQTTGTTTVTAVQDVLDEANETVILDITGVTNGLENGTQQQTITITDDDDPPSVVLSVNTVNIAEAAGVGTVTATLSAVSGQVVTVTLTASGSATGGGTDYTLASSTITIPAGQTTGTTTVTGIQDILDEVDEAVILDITGVANGIENGNQQVTFIINDDDNPPAVNLDISPSSIVEEAGVSTVIARLSAISSLAVTVTLTASGTATGGGTDYTLASSTITIPAGQTTGTTKVTAVQDILVEGNETVILDISGVVNGTENGIQQQTITIADVVIPEVTLSVSPSSIAEAAGVSTVTATLSAAPSKIVTVALSSTQGSNNQFSYSNWNINEPNNTNSSEHYAMLTNGRWNDIPNTIGNAPFIQRYLYLLETNQLINSLQGYTYLGQHQGHSYFKSNSTIGSWTAARDQASQDGGYLVTITSQNEQNLINSWFVGQAFIGLYQDINDPNYSEPSGGWKWVNSNSGTAVNGTDYIISSSTITIPAGQTTGTTTVTAIQDVLVEGNETVVLDITGVTNGTENGTQQQTITIIDDDNSQTVNVTLSVSSSSITEAAGTSTVTAILSGVSNQAVTVAISASGTATGGGTDYTLSSSTITIPAGQTTGTTTVTAIQDVLVEGNETVVLDITGVTNGTENGTQQQTITIIDDDSNNPPTIGNQTFSIQEKSANGTEVGTIVASDQDNDPLAFTINGGSGESTFSLEESTGKLTVKDNTKLDAAMNASLKLTVKVSDGYSDSSAEMTINITSKVLAIEEVVSQIFNVYPIPASRKLKVVLKDNVAVKRIEFIDYSGKAIAPKQSKRKDNTLTLDVSNLYSGIYILNLVTEKGRSKSRIIIE